MASDARPWIKLWARWYESSSHALLSAEALHTGPHLLTIAGKFGRRDDGSAALVGPQGEALTIAALAKMTRWTSAKMARIVAELRQCGTLDVDGATYCFPRFTRWQESSSASRVRKHRTPKPGVTVTPEKRPKIEDRGEKTEEREPPPPPTSRPVQAPRAAGGTTARLSAEGWKHEWQVYRWPEVRESVGQALQCPTSGAAKTEGVQRALDDFGPALVEQVIAHEARAAAEHVRTQGASGRNPALFGRMFVGDGFAARLEDYRRETAIAKPPEPTESIAEKLARLDAERGGVA